MSVLSDLIPEADVVLALEQDELGFHILKALRRRGHQHQSPTLDSFIIGALGLRHPQSRGESPPYPANLRDELERAIREAWYWLEGTALLIPSNQIHGSERILSRRAEKLAKAADPHRAFSARRLPKDSLHPTIREDVWALYHRGKYDTAVFEAMKAVEVAVRDAAGLTAHDIGAPLMRKAFNSKSGPLTDMSTGEAEREARAHLFAGAMGSYRNPHAHLNISLDDPDETAEIIMLANHLLRIVVSRRAARASTDANISISEA
jgi:uncharacterized protein (TIGR02391 family)